jgi:hypothetical protein
MYSSATLRDEYDAVRLLLVTAARDATGVYGSTGCGTSTG